MSIPDLKNSTLESISRSCHSSFSESLKATFQINGQRKPVEHIWLNPKKPEILEPIIKTSTQIKPIMSKEPRAEPIDTVIAEKGNITEESSHDLSVLLDTLGTFASSSSQIQMQVISEALQELLALSLNQLTHAVESIDFVSWSVDITSELFKMIEETENISSANIILLVYAAAYCKVVNLNASAPRTLMNSITNLAKVEGKAVMDGLVIPLIFQSGLSKPQLEVVIKTINEAFNPIQRLLLLQVILSDGEIYFTNSQNSIKGLDRKYLRPWNENIFQIFNTTLSTQPLVSLTSACLFNLVQPIKAIVQTNPKDKSSMQLLLILTSKYAQALVEFNALDLIEEICQASNMFLKRAVTSQISSIKKKISQ